jgi:hypothetical protein
LHVLDQKLKLIFGVLSNSLHIDHVDFRHQNVKEIIPVGRLERNWNHILENISKRNSWQETEKERLQTNGTGDLSTDHYMQKGQKKTS